MRWRDARAILEYWCGAPPVTEMLALLARVYTTWRPAGKPMTEEEAREALMAEQEKLWRSGAAMNAEQLFKAMGGRSPVAMSSQGTLQVVDPGGVGPWPFEVKH